MMEQISMAINVFVAVFSVVSWLQIVLERKESRDLQAKGRESFKYFTVQSNLFLGAVCAAYVFVWFTHGEQIPMWLAALKLVSTTSVMITFIAVIVLLIPKYGVKPMYSGGSFWMHLVLPLLAAIDYLFFMPSVSMPSWVTLCTLVPPALYGWWYLRNVLVHGAEENGKVYDWYGFLRWGPQKIPVLSIAMFMLTLAIAACLRMVSGLV